MTTRPRQPSRDSGEGETPRDLAFVNAMRLNGREWLVVLAIVLLVLGLVPRGWRAVERFEADADYRVPYELSRDYWLYERHLDRMQETDIAVVGDSVVWGEYVRPDGTLSHFLNEQSDSPERFANAGVNGLFPLALEGLVRHHGRPLRNRKVLLHCNLLWMTSPKADLSTTKEERFNHAGLVPQFRPRIPSYKADVNRRLVRSAQQRIEFLRWVNHLQVAHYDRMNFLQWTLADDGQEPARYPNSYRNPFAPLRLEVPGEPADDPERGPASERHRPWSANGPGTARFDWVPLERSLQWSAFLRLVHLLESRDNDVLVVVGPLNDHLMDEPNRFISVRYREAVSHALDASGIPVVVPKVLPSELFADASHPLTRGYALLAEQLMQEASFQQWLRGTGQ